ncbi:hypothetical protein HNO88_003783 [Novosphingobium chloroacetimidivorans]|uniref:Lipoprotein n=1 Tax=Novosphingobium chloroacetimidivorans TaxID=1428314 RepID=A0A7W7KCS3_9SPHN|nr:hypothetical protein [Novosphingobium chloroacetimidivorans]MBB4860440.1 hypothetical protein [Novosphingobium chloroacetimidivorans]
MKETLPLIALVGALALSACSKSPEQPAAQPSSSEETQPVRPSPTPPSEAAEALPTSLGATEASAEPSPTPSASATTAVNEIPRAIRGRWGLVPKDCTSKLGDAKGLLTVSANQLKFYEAVAKLGKVKDAQADSLRATYAFSGEGQAWTLDVALDVQNGGKTLIRRDTGKDALPGPLKYTRCT